MREVQFSFSSYSGTSFQKLPLKLNPPPKLQLIWHLLPYCTFDLNNNKILLPNLWWYCRVFARVYSMKPVTRTCWCWWRMMKMTSMDSWKTFSLFRCDFLVSNKSWRAEFYVCESIVDRQLEPLAPVFHSAVQACLCSQVTEICCRFCQVRRGRSHRWQRKNTLSPLGPV